MSAIPPTTKLRRPDGLAEIIDTFGDPRPYLGQDGLLAPEWPLRHITSVKLLEPLRYGFSTVKRVACHVLVAQQVKDAFEQIADEGHWEKIREFGGGYECRAMRGGGGLSTHAWGIGICLLPEADERGRLSMPREIVRIFARHGFAYGGDYCRPNHFQYATGYGLEWPELAALPEAVAV